MKMTLKDTCEFYSGTGFPTVYQGSASGKYPFYKVGDISKNVQQGYKFLEICDNYIDDDIFNQIKGVLIPKNSIAFAKIGEALKLNRRAITKQDCLVDNNAVAICPNQAILDVDYFYYFMRTVNLTEYSSSTTVPSVKKSSLEKIQLPVPTLNEQKNIANELNSINNALSLAKQRLLSLDELVKSRFIEMFGEPLSNSKGYDLTDYGSLFELNAGGTPSKNKPEYWVDGNISWIGSNMCQDTILYENDGKYITELGFNNSSARKFPINTVLVALVGATIGKTALLKFETTTNQNVLGIRGIEESGNNPYFVFYYTQGLHKLFLDIGDGGFAMASKSFISKLPFPIVDISLQNEFAEFVKLIDKSKFIVQQQIKDLEELLDSKMDEYFR